MVVKAGENAYTIRVIPSYGSTQTATYEKGNLMIAGMVACSFLDGKIISDGVAYEKVNGNYSGSGTTDQRNTPSAKEREEKRIADSIRVADSLAMVQAEMQRKLDMQRKAKGR